ncbi:MAG: hypothetical protein FD174_856 [Geobacteraceae bacterium]|nr:MAG: hypothetical protein FD174_856 [Geobacteraceae bacterium]
MTDILLIADQQRLHEIFAAASALPGVRVRVATALNQGLQEIAAEAPSLLFIQSRLSGLSGEIITRHVKSELKDGSTKIILFTEVANDGGAGETPADIILDLAAPDKELVDRIQEIIAGHGQSDNESAVTGKVAAQKEASTTPLAENVVDSVSIGREETASSSFHEELESLIGKSGAAKERFSFEPGRDPKGIQRKKRWLFPAISLLAVVIVAGITLFSGRSHEPVKKASPSPPPPVKPLPNVTKAPIQAATPPLPQLPQLPGFVPREGMDARYGETHPGWERYVSAAAEFKVYREKSAIKALQVLDRSGDGIKPQFFTKVVQEMADVRDYTLEAKEHKGDYLIKKGRLTAKSRVILYKKKSDTVLQAFVIYFE